MKCRICGEEISEIEHLTDVKSDVNRYYRNPIKQKKINADYGYCTKCLLGQIDYLLDDKFYDGYAMLQDDIDKDGRDRGITARYEKYYREMLGRLASITDHERLLDIGCGSGTLLTYGKDYYDTVKGVEPSVDACASGRSRGVDIVNGYFDENWSDGEYSVITATQVLEHLEDPVKTLRLIARNLRGGGTLYADVPNGGRIHANGRYYDVYLEHINYWSLNALVAAVTYAGLRVIEAKEIHDGNHICIIAIKDGNHKGYNGDRIIQTNRLNTAIRKYNAFSIWGCGVKGSVFVRGISNHKLKYLFDSDIRLEGLYVDDFEIPISYPDAAKINENDLIVITATEHRDDIEKDLRNRYDYKGDILAIDDTQYNCPLLKGM